MEQSIQFTEPRYYWKQPSDAKEAGDRTPWHDSRTGRCTHVLALYADDDGHIFENEWLSVASPCAGLLHSVLKGDSDVIFYSSFLPRVTDNKELTVSDTANKIQVSNNVEVQSKTIEPLVTDPVTPNHGCLEIIRRSHLISTGFFAELNLHQNCDCITDLPNDSEFHPTHINSPLVPL